MLKCTIITTVKCPMLARTCIRQSGKETANLGIRSFPFLHGNQSLDCTRPHHKGIFDPPDEERACVLMGLLEGSVFGEQRFLVESTGLN